MADIDQVRLRETLVARDLCDAQTAASIGEVCQELWESATRDFASEDKIALAVADLKSALLEAAHESERVQVERFLELKREMDAFRREQAERHLELRRETDEFRREQAAHLLELQRQMDASRREQEARLLELQRQMDAFRREQAERDAQFRREQADRDQQRDRRLQWLMGLGFTAFGALASVLAVFA